MATVVLCRDPFGLPALPGCKGRPADRRGAFGALFRRATAQCEPSDAIYLWVHRYYRFVAHWCGSLHRARHRAFASVGTGMGLAFVVFATICGPMLLQRKVV
jgi:hypothetical protein